MQVILVEYVKVKEKHVEDTIGGILIKGGDAVLWQLIKYVRSVAGPYQ